MTPIVIGLAGKKRSGKDTLADFLVTDHGYTRMKFASPILEALNAMDPLVPDLLPGLDTTKDYGHIPFSAYVSIWGIESAKHNPEVRRLMQVFGTEVGRDMIHPDVWVKILVRKWKQNPPERTVITDVRFPNELQAVLNVMYGVAARVVRPGLVSTDNHTSENSIDHVEMFEVVNDGAVEDLRMRATELHLSAQKAVAL